MKKDVMELFADGKKPTAKDVGEFSRARKHGGVKLEDLDRHIILYTKGHYKEYPNVTLNSIFAQWCSLYVHQVKEEQVMGMMLRSYERLVKLGIIKIDMEEMFNELFKHNRYLKGDSWTISPESIIAYIRSTYVDLIISHDGKNLIDLGDIDPELETKIQRLL